MIAIQKHFIKADVFCTFNCTLKAMESIAQSYRDQLAGILLVGQKQALRVSQCTVSHIVGHLRQEVVYERTNPQVNATVANSPSRGMRQDLFTAIQLSNCILALQPWRANKILNSTCCLF